MIRPIRILAVAAVVSLSGCAFTEAKIDLHYVPDTNAHMMPGAASIPVSVTVSDVRANTGRVSSKVNGYGAELAAIISNQPVPALVQGALETELKARGYPVNPNGVPIVCEIYDFFNKFQVGFWSGAAVANVRLNVKVRDHNGNYIFSEMVSGSSTTEHIQMASGENAAPALDAALQKTIAALFHREDFYRALDKATK